MACDLDEMLSAIGAKSVEELFRDIPERVRTGALALPPGKGERLVRAEVAAMMGRNLSAESAPCFMGAGFYDHYIPSALKAIVMRSEFVTSYTPYQPEVSQGILQALFEFQCLMAELTGMDVVNDSMYDGATALAEAALMSARATGRKEFAVPRALSWEHRSVLHNYLDGPGVKLVDYDFDPMTGASDPSSISRAVGGETAGLYVQSPNHFGVLEELLPEARDMAGKALLVVGANPLSLALCKPPADFGADIYVGDAQPFGCGLSYGGPSVGIIAARREHARRMPGRIVGMTADSSGKRAFCLTLQTREQHIRRSKATSNICSNQALMALTASAYMALMGRAGLTKVAEESVENAHLLAGELSHTRDVRSPLFRGPFFNEFAAGLPLNAPEVNRRLARKGVIGGVPLDLHEQGLGDAMLLACTEQSDAAAREALVKGFKGVLA